MCHLALLLQPGKLLQAPSLAADSQLGKRTRPASTRITRSPAQRALSMRRPAHRSGAVPASSESSLSHFRSSTEAARKLRLTPAPPSSSATLERRTVLSGYAH